MKNSKIFIGASLLLFAALGAFATTSAHTLNRYYWFNGETCVPVDVEFQCTPDPNQSCIDPAIPSHSLTGSVNNGATCSITLKQG